MDGNFVLFGCIHILVDVLNEPAGARLPPTLSPGYAPGPFLLTARASIAMTTLELPAKSVLCTLGNPITTTLQIDRAVFNNLAPKGDLNSGFQSTDGANPFLAFCFSRCNWLRWKLKHRCFLTLQQVS